MSLACATTSVVRYLLTQEFLLADSVCLAQPVTIPATGTIDFSYHSSVHNLYVGSSPCAFTTQICPAEDASVISTSAPCKYTPGKPGAPSLLMRNCCRRCCYLLSLSRGGKAKVSVCCLVKSHLHLIASSSIDSTSTSVLTIPITEYPQISDLHQLHSCLAHVTSATKHQAKSLGQ